MLAPGLKNEAQYAYALVAQIKVKIFNMWPKINTLISSFNFLGGVRGFAVKIMTPTGCLTGLGVISPRGLVGGGPTHVVVSKC